MILKIVPRAGPCLVNGKKFPKKKASGKKVPGKKGLLNFDMGNL
jgi:hypothetical protein